MTDSQVAEEQFLVLINDLLASGEIPGLFQDDEVENIIGSMRPQVKSLGMQDTRENCWKYFIDKVRRQLKVGNPCVFGWSRIPFFRVGHQIQQCVVLCVVTAGPALSGCQVKQSAFGGTVGGTG